MNENKQDKRDLAPEEQVAFLESLLMMEHSAPVTDNLPVYLKHLSDEDPHVRATAIGGLWYSPGSAVLDRLIEMAEQDPSPMVRGQAISGLGIYIHEGVMADYGFEWGGMAETMREGELPEADFERAKDFLLDVYGDETRTLDERRFAIEALGFLSDPPIADLIKEAYRRPEREMKISALFAMGRSGMVRWKKILRQELHNPDRDIQREAIRAVGEIGMDELGKELLRLTYADDQEIVIEALVALGQTGWEGGFGRLDDLVHSPDPEIAEVAEEALEEWLFMDQLLRHELDPYEDEDDWMD